LLSVQTLVRCNVLRLKRNSVSVSVTMKDEHETKADMTSH
jgi:hypothetical protein